MIITLPLFICGFFISTINLVPLAQAEVTQSLLSICIHRTVKYNRSYTVSACRYWNKLPDNIYKLPGMGRRSSCIFGLWETDTCLCVSREIDEYVQYQGLFNIT